VVTTLT